MIDLTGRWSGSYSYPNNQGPFPFSIDLLDHGGNITGEIEEDGEGFREKRKMHSHCAGSHDSQHVRFTKIYDDVGRVPHVIVYEGEILDDGHEISGMWTIPGDWTGPFVMIRPRNEEASVEEAVSVEL